MDLVFLNSSAIYQYTEMPVQKYLQHLNVYNSGHQKFIQVVIDFF